MIGQKRRLQALFFALVLILVFLLAAQPKIGSAEGGYTLWSEYSTEKIRRDEQYAKAQAGDRALHVSMVRGERESVQLIISADRDIASYNVQLAPLTSTGGDVFPVEKMKVFNQCYIQTLRQSNSYYEPGWYPDAILPFETAVEYGENKVAAGENQGIWFRFDATGEEMPAAGTYTGTFVLTIDGAAENIPVSVKVYDLTIPEYEWDSTSYLFYPEYLTYGERDSSYEMWVQYYEFFLDYGISLFGMPIEGTDTDLFLENLVKYYDQMGSYGLPYISTMTRQSGKHRMGPDYEHLEDMIRRVIALSHDKGVDYLKKSYIYNLYIDEYTATHAFGNDRIESAARFAPYVKNIFESCVEYFDSAYGPDYIDSVPGLRDSILNIRLISVSSWLDGVTDLYNVFCTAFPGYNLEEDRRDYAEKMSGEFEEMWWYGGVGTNYPSSPSYQIDDPLIDERVLGWMAYDYNIKGNLYWQVNLYSDASPGYYLPGDPWELANRSVGSVNGDGYLCYPGQKYGIYGPVGTIRLEAIRDGMEETKVLRLFDEIYANLSEYYGESFSLRATMQSVYDSLYSGVLANLDSENFAAQREMVLEAMSLANQPERLVLSEFEEDLNGYDVGVVLDVSATVEGDYENVRETANGKGKVYTFRVEKGEGDSVLSFDYMVGGQKKTYRKVLGEGYYTKVAFDKAEDAQVITLNGAEGTAKNGVVTESGQTGESITLVSPSVAGISGPYISFVPSEVFAEEIGSLKAIAFDIYNAGEEDIDISIVQRTKNQNGIVYDLTLQTSTLKAGTWNRIVVKDMSVIEYAQDFRIVMPRTANMRYDLIISKLSYNTVSGEVS